MARQPVPESSFALVIAIMLALLAWGLLLAVGAAWFGDDSLKPWLLLGSVVAFAGLWGGLLAVRRRR